MKMNDQLMRADGGMRVLAEGGPMFSARAEHEATKIAIGGVEIAAEHIVAGLLILIALAAFPKLRKVLV